MRVLHVLHTSLPFLCGYSIRSDYILRFQLQNGIEPAVVTSAQQPPCAEPFVHENQIPHWRTEPLRHSLPPVAREIALMHAIEKQIRRHALQWKPDLIHAHSPMLVGLPALRVAQQLGIPLVYEVRDLWENASVDRGKFSEGSASYKIARALETRVLKNAEAAVTICRTLSSHIESRVRSPEGLFVVDNGVDAHKFSPIQKSKSFLHKFDLNGKIIIAYIGTFQPYEGLNTLISSLPAVIKVIPTAHLMIVGSGGEEQALRQQVERGGLQSAVTFTGRLDHSEVANAYSVADIMVYPRTLTRTTALTTPLKPLEAMAMGKAVLVSDVPAMKELVVDGSTGLTFRAGDETDLAQKCLQLLKSSALRQSLEAAARRWVEEERDWPNLIARYRRVYEYALSVVR